MSQRASFASFLRTSLQALEQECPQAHRQMCARLCGREIEIRVDEELVAVQFGTEAVVLSRRSKKPCVTVTSTRTAILELVDARVSLTKAILSEALDLRGAPSDLSAFFDSFEAYLRGAVRAPSFPDILSAYRNA